MRNIATVDILILTIFYILAIFDILDITLFDSWVSSLDGVLPESPVIDACMAEDEETKRADWLEIQNGFSEDFMLRRSCYFAGRTVTCAWNLKHFEFREVVQLSSIANRNRGPPIMGYRKLLDASSHATYFGEPSFFFRFSFTSAYRDIMMSYLMPIPLQKLIVRGVEPTAIV